MNAITQSNLPKVLTIALISALIMLGTASPTLARGDHHGHRGADCCHQDRHHHRHHRHDWKGAHRHHYRYPRYYRHRPHRHYYYGYPYEAYGLGVLTGILLNEYYE